MVSKILPAADDPDFVLKLFKTCTKLQLRVEELEQLNEKLTLTLMNTLSKEDHQ
jgi:hypothetical protein